MSHGVSLALVLVILTYQFTILYVNLCIPTEFFYQLCFVFNKKIVIVSVAWFQFGHKVVIFFVPNIALFSVDTSRFWVAVRFQQLYCHRRFGSLESMEELHIDSSLFAWAFHSDCQDNLFSSVLPNEPSWQEMRNMGVGFWFTDATQLRTKVIVGAQFSFLILSSILLPSTSSSSSFFLVLQFIYSYLQGAFRMFYI